MKRKTLEEAVNEAPAAKAEKPKRLTIADARLTARRLGFSLRKTQGGDYRLAPVGMTQEQAEKEAYYADSLTDAIDTARAFAKRSHEEWHDKPLAQFREGWWIVSNRVADGPALLRAQGAIIERLLDLDPLACLRVQRDINAGAPEVSLCSHRPSSVWSVLGRVTTGETGNSTWLFLRPAEQKPDVPTAPHVELERVWTDDHILCCEVTVGEETTELWWCGYEGVAAATYANDSPTAMVRLIELVEEQKKTNKEDQ